MVLLIYVLLFGFEKKEIIIIVIITTTTIVVLVANCMMYDAECTVYYLKCCKIFSKIAKNNFLKFVQNILDGKKLRITVSKLLVFDVTVM